MGTDAHPILRRAWAGHVDVAACRPANVEKNWRGEEMKKGGLLGEEGTVHDGERDGDVGGRFGVGAGVHKNDIVRAGRIDGSGDGEVAADRAHRHFRERLVMGRGLPKRGTPLGLSEGRGRAYPYARGSRRSGWA